MYRVAACRLSWESTPCGRRSLAGEEAQQRRSKNAKRARKQEIQCFLANEGSRLERHQLTGSQSAPPCSRRSARKIDSGLICLLVTGAPLHSKRVRGRPHVVVAALQSGENDVTLKRLHKVRQATRSGRVEATPERRQAFYTRPATDPQCLDHSKLWTQESC